MDRVMSKQSKKAPQPPATPPPAPRKSPGLLLGAAAVLGLAVVAFVFMRGGEQPAVPAEASIAPVAPATDASHATHATPAQVQQPVVVPKPHPQKDLPPLRMPGYPLGRSPEVITAAYRFAAEHPEVLTYVPCFCGCERGGHRGNEDCFVKARAANGDVTEWEEHGMECNVCLDVAQQAMQMHASGASVRDIRAAVEAKWAGQATNHTPTPEPPK
jgi:hypothetical protein